MFTKKKMTKEMKQNIINFLLYPESAIDSMSKYRENLKIMEVLSMMYGKTSILDEDMWNKLEGFSDLNEAKEFLKSIEKSSDSIENCETSNLLFLYGCVVVYEDNLKKGKYSFS